MTQIPEIIQHFQPHTKWGLEKRCPAVWLGGILINHRFTSTVNYRVGDLLLELQRTPTDSPTSPEQQTHYHLPSVSPNPNQALTNPQKSVDNSPLHSLSQHYPDHLQNELSSTRPPAGFNSGKSQMTNTLNTSSSLRPPSGNRKKRSPASPAWKSTAWFRASPAELRAIMSSSLGLS